MSFKKFDSDEFERFAKSEAMERLRASLAKIKEEYYQAMTLERALYVRELRVNGLTWRAIASATAHEWDGDWGSNQIDGMYICEAAARFMNEDPHTAPWN